jgi:hypothetical protein
VDASIDSLLSVRVMRSRLLMDVRIVFEDEESYDHAINEAKAEALSEAAADWQAMQRTDDHMLAQWLRARSEATDPKGVTL